MQKNTPKVSIITPCYNTSKYLDAYFEGILKDTYSNVELIMVDDGSTDDTKRKILSYRLFIEKKGGELIYIFQQNQGAASAVSRGLKVFTGEYLIWPDSDDVLINNSIADRVEYMETHPEIDFLLTNYITVEESTNQIVKNSSTELCKINEDTFFDDLLQAKGGVGPPYYMVRANVVHKQIPLLNLHENGSGQNYPMVLPMVYRKKVRVWLESKPYYSYLIRTTSHSHAARASKEKYISHIDRVIESIITTVKNIPNMSLIEKQQYDSIINKDLKYRLHLLTSYEQNDKEHFLAVYNEYLGMGKWNAKMYMRKLFIKHPFLRIIYEKLRHNETSFS